MPESPLIAHVLRLLTNQPHGTERLLPLILALVLGEEEIQAETGTVYLCDPVDSLEASKAVAKFATRVFMTTEGRPTEHSGQMPSLPRFEEDDGSVAGYVLASGETHICAECQSCDLYMRSPSDPQFRSLMCLPIVYGKTASQRPRVLGLINLHTKQSSRRWSEDHALLIEAWAHITALVISANYHELTMLPNRPFTEHLLGQSITDSQSLYLAYVDIDRFSHVNETFGHRSANEVIQRFAGVLKRTAGEEARVCHIHGDEFVLIIRNKTREEALAKVRAVLSYIRGNQTVFRVGDQVVSDRMGNRFSATAGLAEWSHGMEAHELIDAADEANAQQKHRRRGYVRANWAVNT